MKANLGTPALLLVVGLAALLLSAIGPHDYLTWLLEVFPVLLALPLLLATSKRFPLTPLLYWLIFLHALVLMVGGHYTYASVPLGEWAKECLGWQRNNYDRLGHFMQGFEPAILAREILLRKQVVRRGGWLVLFVLSVTMAFSAIYELVEWAVALISAQAAESFLGTQGDVWDTQWDMFMCLIGASWALLLLVPLHDRELARMNYSVGPGFVVKG